MYPIFLVLLKDDTKTDQAFKVKRVWARIICALTLVKVMVKGQENLPPKPYVICANHASYLDISYGVYNSRNFFVFRKG